MKTKKPPTRSLRPVTEKWRTIPDFPNYVVSTNGRFANKNTGNELVVNIRGQVCLCRCGFEGKRSASKLYNQIWPEYAC